jgi:hypothetical protein
MMTDTKLSSLVGAGLRVRHLLRKKGCHEVKTYFFNRRPMIEVTCPPAELLAHAERNTESHNGITRSVWMASYCGCFIIWR